MLPNGLTLLVHEDHKAPIAAVNIWYHVGSKNEKPGKSGFAHLFEHLMFNGSEHYNDDYFQALERIGATDLNGTTNQDRTNYLQNVPVSALDQVRAVSQQVVQPDAVNWFMVGDKAKNIEKLDALGFDQIIEIDADGNPKTPTLKSTEVEMKN